MWRTENEGKWRNPRLNPLTTVDLWEDLVNNMDVLDILDHDD